MNKGFNRVGARCNIVFWAIAIVISWQQASGAQTPFQQTFEEPVAIPQLRPDIEHNRRTQNQNSEILQDRVESKNSNREQTDQQEVPEKKAEPKRIYQSACPAVLSKLVTARFLPPIDDNGCGERSPLALESLNLDNQSITLSSNPQVNCRMANAMAQWGIKANEAAKAAFDSTLATILTGRGYQCRRRNNLPDGKISEHGFANAMDITGFRLENGTEILVERDWGDSAENASLEGLFLRTVHKAACSMFTTVLGPEADQYHRDHFHFDLGCHGRNCTYLICE